MAGLGMGNPKGPSTHYLWFLVTIKAPKSLNTDYLEPQGKPAGRRAPTKTCFRLAHPNAKTPNPPKDLSKPVADALLTCLFCGFRV